MIISTRMLSVICGLFLPFLTEAAIPECQVIEQQNIKTLPLAVMTSYVQTFIFEQSSVPALMIGIISGNERAVISCGETVKNNGQRPRMNTVWPIGSVSKVFTTQMLAKMVNQGVVRLNTPIDSLLNGTGKQIHPITLLDLATHSSGFPRQLPTLPQDNDYQTNYPYDMPQFISWYESYKPTYAPGSHYLYSNVAFGLLGQLLAKEMHTNYGNLLQLLISKPLELVDTTVTLSPEQTKRKVASYWLNGDLIKKDWEFRFEQPSGGIYSTMADLLKFTRYQLSKSPAALQDTILAQASYVYQSQFDNPLDFGKDAMALGWTVDFPAQGLPVQLTKNGWVNGVTSHIQLTPSAEIGVISFTNKPYLNINFDLKKLAGMILAARTKPITETT
ncbi:serine hydrolase [Legionella feeleii]|uniref:AMPC cephalosporinase n=1 Tax=Legionella feeleii TaxID=453 RepID=A0A0W0U1Q0_9GAMM|nr:serine hydrolase [Legionella feeleii]KTD01451.1 AMPC cephalosporinase [Legionella feeleii]SPX61260.1 AMPC cephalosporinase [Legionella feeleii]